MDFVNKLASKVGGNSSSEGNQGANNNDNMNKGIDYAQKQFVKPGQGNNDNINKGIDFAQKSFLGHKDKPEEQKVGGAVADGVQRNEGN